MMMLLLWGMAAGSLFHASWEAPFTRLGDTRMTLVSAPEDVTVGEGEGPVTGAGCETRGGDCRGCTPGWPPGWLVE